MPRFERDHTKHNGPLGSTQLMALSPSGSSADADDSAAHIAELVRRTVERDAAASPSCVQHPGVPTAWQPPMHPPTVAQPVPQPVAKPVAQPVAKPVAQPVAKPVAQPVAQPVPQPVAQPVPQPVAKPVAQHDPLVPPTTQRPTRRTLVAAGAGVALVIGVGVAMSYPFSPESVPTATTPDRPRPAEDRSASAGSPAAPAGYTVKVTDTITDCASHAHGRTRDSFETQNCVKATRSLATGQVSGRAALFVLSRIHMASAESAASVKQVLDQSGTGNLNDLLREGETFQGAPDKMPSSGYASVQRDGVVTVAEAGFVDGGRSSSANPSLRAAAAQVVAAAGATS